MEAPSIGLHIPAEDLQAAARKNFQKKEDEEEEGDEEEEAGEEEDIDEVTGYHFVDCAALFVAYVYVNSGKIFTVVASSS